MLCGVQLRLTLPLPEPVNCKLSCVLFRRMISIIIIIPQDNFYGIDLRTLEAGATIGYFSQARFRPSLSLSYATRDKSKTKSHIKLAC